MLALRTFAFILSLVFIFSVPWEGVLEYPILGSMSKLIGLVLTAVWVLSVVRTRRLRKPGPFQIVVYLFVLWNAASIFWSADPYDSAFQVWRWVQLLIIVLILWDLYTTRTALLAGLQAFILGEFVAVGSALTNFTSGTVFYSHYQRFSQSEQNNPDGFGIILALGVPVAWYLASLKSTSTVSRLLKFINYAYIPAAFWGIALSGTRTALIATVPGMVFGFASLTQLRLAARMAIFLFLTLALLIMLPRVQNLKSFQRFGTIAGEVSGGDLNNRTNNWREGLIAFTEHPLLGVGSDQYRSVNSWNKLAHNSFISVLVELGLIGFALFGIIVMIAVIQALNQPTKWESSFWLTVLLTWAMCAFTLTYEYRKATWLLLSFAVASAALTRYRVEAVSLVRRDEPDAQVIP